MFRMLQLYHSEYLRFLNILFAKLWSYNTDSYARHGVFIAFILFDHIYCKVNFNRKDSNGVGS